jgi:hypothetical protein
MEVQYDNLNKNRPQSRLGQCLIKGAITASFICILIITVFMCLLRGDIMELNSNFRELAKLNLNATQINQFITCIGSLVVEMCTPSWHNPFMSQAHV